MASDLLVQRARLFGRDHRTSSVDCGLRTVFSLTSRYAPIIDFCSPARDPDAAFDSLVACERRFRPEAAVRAAPAGEFRRPGNPLLEALG